MHQHLKFFVFGVICCAGFLTISNHNAQAQNNLPPLINREIFFDNPEIAGAQISPDGRFIAFRKPLKGTMNIWVKRTEEAFDKARPLTNRTDRPIPSFFWSRDGKYILFVQDKGGDENFNVYAVNPAENPASGAEVPAARNLTEAQKVRAFIYGVPETDPDAIYVGLNERDKAWHDVYKVKISTGERTLVMENKERLQGVVFDNADKMRLATRVPPSGDTEILLLDGEKPRVIYSCNVFEECSPVRFHKDNKRVYLETNKGNVDLSQLVLLDVTTGREENVESDPLKKVDFGNAIFSDLTDELIATTYNDERIRYHFKNKDFEKDYKYIKEKLGDRDVNFVSSTKDESRFIVATSSDVDPGTVWLFDRKTRNLSTLYQVREKLNREYLAPMKAVRYKSSDGLEIPAFLTVPKGVASKNLPAVIVPHGGPWSRDFWGYNSMAQFLANRGYAVLQPNFRASAGYGKKFLNAGNNEWGQKMQDDLTWGVRYLVEQGIADPKRVGIMGGSYGGYATLAGVTFTPDLYAAGVAIVAPSNLRTLLETIPPYWEAGRTIFYKRMGDPNTPEGRAQIERQSPLSHVAKIKTPLLVVQGANDPRVNKRESDQIVIALRDRGFPVEYLVAPDEGHGFARPVNNMAMIAKAEKFLAKHLGGRYQESMTPEVAKRLEEITVDPKTVTVAIKAEMNAAPAVNISGKWSLTANAGGQELPITMELTQTGGGFSGSLSSMMGGGKVESGKVSGKNIVATARVEVQGQSMELKMEGTIEGDKITGTFSGPGLPPISFTGGKSN
ncbi:MAG: S9 family peptidase [Acidobacteriota bacterium]|nr:S9 family peptidase [Acidobacteriota bacterium]